MSRPTSFWFLIGCVIGSIMHGLSGGMLGYISAPMFICTAFIVDAIYRAAAEIGRGE